MSRLYLRDNDYFLITMKEKLKIQETQRSPNKRNTKKNTKDTSKSKKGKIMRVAREESNPSY